MKVCVLSSIVPCTCLFCKNSPTCQNWGVNPILTMLVNCQELGYNHQEAGYNRQEPEYNRQALLKFCPGYCIFQALQACYFYLSFLI